MALDRKPLFYDVKSRDFESTKDPLAVNVFYDKNIAGTIYAVKRPGIITEIVGTGLAQGIFYYEGKVYSWTDANNPLAPDEFDPTEADDFGTFTALRDYQDPDNIEMRLVEFTPSPMNYQTGDYIKSPNNVWPIPDNSVVDATTVGLGPSVTRISHDTVQYKGIEFMSSSILGEAVVTSTLGGNPIIVIGASFTTQVTTSYTAISNTGGLTYSLGANMPANTAWSGVTRGETLYVAVAGLGAAVADDTNIFATAPVSASPTWTQRTLPEIANYSSVATNGTVFAIAANAASRLYYTTDGITINSYQYDPLRDEPGCFVAYNGSIFCNYMSTENSSNLALIGTLTSPDGTNWTFNSIALLSASNLPYANVKMCTNDGLFVAASCSGNQFKSGQSTDGVNWTAGTIFDMTPYVPANGNANFTLNHVATNGDIYVALFGSTGGSAKTAWYYLYSTDGLTWTANTLPVITPNTASYRVISSQNGMFSVISNNGRLVTSTDGINWTTQPNQPALSVGIWNCSVS